MNGAYKIRWIEKRNNGKLISLNLIRIVYFVYRYVVTFGDEKGRIINIDSKILKTFDEKYVSFNSSSISVVKYSPNGETLVCGTSNGELWILNAENRKCLGKENPFRNKSLSKITHCAFHDDYIFAIAVSNPHLKGTI